MNINYVDTDKCFFEGSNNENRNIESDIEQKQMHLSGSYLCAIKNHVNTGLIPCIDTSISVNPMYRLVVNPVMHKITVDNTGFT